MSIEQVLAATHEAQVRQAEALEGIYACLQVLVKRTEEPQGARLVRNQPAEEIAEEAVEAEAPKPARGGSRRQAKNQERPEPVEETVVEEEPETVEDDGDPLDELDAPVPEVTADDVKEALRAYREINGTPAMMNLFKKYGAQGMGTLKAEDYAAIVKDAR